MIIIGLAVSIHFYKKTHRWVALDPIHHKIIQKEPDFQCNTAFKRDMFNVNIGVTGPNVISHNTTVHYSPRTHIPNGFSHYPRGLCGHP